MRQDGHDHLALRNVGHNRPPATALGRPKALVGTFRLLATWQKITPRSIAAAMK